ncbi:heavy metal-responsive transcriptional regulator [Streptomyces sp. NBC_00637]|uniref:heavy metal-responsive transcriptional regulator n=1 Tax=Streptomyces sp. NBC_00637 TaxID=2903667 RepID=UPI002F909A97
MRIGDLAARSGLTTKTIRFYEDSSLLPAPPRTPCGYRDYPDHTVTRLAVIRDAQRAGLTLAEIRSILTLRDDGHAPCTHVTALITEHLDDIDRRMAELAATRQTLRAPPPPTPAPATRTPSAPSSPAVPGETQAEDTGRIARSAPDGAATPVSQVPRS